VIPYIALYLTTNVGINVSYISLIYLCGGIATLMSSRFIGHMADKYGKVRVFRVLAIISLVPLLVTTNLPVTPLWIVLINSTTFFVLVSGRMIPAMALVSQVDGMMEHYNLVGFGAAFCGLLTFWLVGYIHSDAKIHPINIKEPI
jgi:predicted MFS family arabinose efflux permease